MRVLLLSHRLPYATNRGDRIRTRHILEELASFCDVELISLVHSADEAAHTGDLSDLVSRVAVAPVPHLRNRLRAAVALRTREPLTHALLHAPMLAHLVNDAVTRRRPSVIVTSSSGIAPAATAGDAASLPHVLDMVDVDSEKWRAMAQSSPPPLRWVYGTEARRLSRFEGHIAAQASAVLVVTDRERKALTQLAPTARVHVVPNGIAVERFRPPQPPTADPVVTFCGVMSYAPNARAVSWFAHAVWPLVRAQIPQGQLQIVGADPGRSVRALARDRSVTVTGSVADTRPYLWNAAVSIAPLAVARGVQNKVLEAIAAGLPCVVSGPVSEGLPPEVLSACSVARTAHEHADAVVRLLHLTPDERRRLAMTARVEALSWANRLRPLRDLIAAAARD